MPSPVSLKLDTWDDLLQHDPEKDFIMDSLKHGFDIIDNDIVLDNIPPVECNNHKSVTASDVRDRVEQRIKEEIQDGNYVIAHDKPV